MRRIGAAGVAAAAWAVAGGLGLGLAGALAAGCAASYPKDDPEAVWAEGRVFVSDASFRRAVLEDALVDLENDYALGRLLYYALPDGTGWDALPEMTTPTEPVRLSDVAALAAGEALAMDGTAVPLLDAAGSYPASAVELSALGGRAFYEFPVRVETVLEWIAADPARLARYGLAVAADGTIVGMRKFPAPDGSVRIAEACALCHSTVDARGEVVDGMPNGRLDLGAAWADLADEVGVDVDQALQARLRAWGPGRLDVTYDDLDDPLEVPPLTGLRDDPYLQQSGALRHDQASALAMRVETLMITSWVASARPPRAVAFAIAAWTYDLAPPRDVAAAELVGRTRGEHVFAEAGCGTCHDERRAYGSDALVSLEAVGTDPASALSPARGTGAYRVPTLRGVWAFAPYFHDGSVATLEDLLDPRRLESDWTGRPHGTGAAPGHPFGLTLDAPDKAVLLAFLRSL
jgi:hypothetical protein